MMTASITLAAIVSVGISLVLRCFHERHDYEKNRHYVRVRRFPGPAIRILHLSDTHFLKTTRPQSNFFDKLAQETYDLIFLTGDILDEPGGLEACLRELGKLKARYGFYAVLGNHDYYHYDFWSLIAHNFPSQSFPPKRMNEEILINALSRHSIEVLRNEKRNLEINGIPLSIYGLDDPTTGHASIREAFENYEKDRLHLLLTHSIDAFIDIGRDEVDVSFSGHSHGGQLCLPLWGALVTHTVMGRRFASGVFRHKGAVCSVSRGIGTSRYLPFRLFCPPEALEIEILGNPS